MTAATGLMPVGRRQHHVVGYLPAHEMLGYGTTTTIAAATVLLLLAVAHWRVLGMSGDWCAMGRRSPRVPLDGTGGQGAATRNLFTDRTIVDAAGGWRVFKDRRDAGRQLGRRLSTYATLRPVVVALPRGGVPVAAEIADCLDAPLDFIVVRKIGLPWQPELAIGAIAEGHICVLDDALIEEAGVRGDQLEAAVVRERIELERRVRTYRGDLRRRGDDAP